jgi:translation initiation factor IF-1
MALGKTADLERTGIVVESLPNIMFRVRLDETEEEILSYLSGKMRLHRIRVLVGDKVLLELEPYGGKARIIKRL